ncbi:MAG: hypothetical protein ACQET2_14280 [Pseudomonadota bacterium]
MAKKPKQRVATGGGTVHGSETDIAKLIAGSGSPHRFRLHNAQTAGQDTELAFPVGPDEALRIAILLSVAAEDEQAAQELVNSRQVAQAAMLGAQDEYSLTERERLLATTFFDMGMRAGAISGIKLDPVRKEAKATRRRQSKGGKRSVYQAHARYLLPLLDEYIAGRMKQVVFIKSVAEIAGKEPSKDAVRKWRMLRENGAPVWPEQGE